MADDINEPIVRPIVYLNENTLDEQISEAQ